MRGVNYSTRAKQARLQAVLDLLEAGSGPAIVEFVGEPKELRTFMRLSRPCAHIRGSDLVFVDNPIMTNPAEVAGTYTKARLLNGDDELVAELSVGPVGSDACGQLTRKGLHPE